MNLNIKLINLSFFHAGTKKDIKSNDMVNSKDGKKLCKKAGLYKYVECSAKTKENIQEVFTQSILAAVSPTKQPLCTLM